LEGEWPCYEDNKVFEGQPEPRRQRHAEGRNNAHYLEERRHLFDPNLILYVEGTIPELSCYRWVLFGQAIENSGDEGKTCENYGWK
jgi:hypothetical protein